MLEPTDIFPSICFARVAIPYCGAFGTEVEFGVVERRSLEKLKEMFLVSITGLQRTSSSDVESVLKLSLSKASDRGMLIEVAKGWLLSVLVEYDL